MAETAEWVRKLKEDTKIWKKHKIIQKLRRERQMDRQNKTLYMLPGGKNTVSSTLSKCQQPTQKRHWECLNHGNIFSLSSHLIEYSFCKVSFFMDSVAPITSQF